ncbi:MAG: tetratricopeptide repeat protein [Brevinemataceae bacterium]
MKNMSALLLFFMMSNVSKIYTLNPMISVMMPADRHILSLSMIESAQTYENLGRKKKAESYFRTAVEVYPVGDIAHMTADKYNYILDDKKTYEKFIVSGDLALEKKQYKLALASYLMAQEIETSPELFQKLADTYALNNQNENAQFYQDLANGIDPSSQMMLSDDQIRENRMSNTNIESSNPQPNLANENQMMNNEQIQENRTSNTNVKSSNPQPNRVNGSESFNQMILSDEQIQQNRMSNTNMESSNLQPISKQGIDTNEIRGIMNTDYENQKN